jgi:hypothetical protein
MVVVMVMVVMVMVVMVRGGLRRAYQEKHQADRDWDCQPCEEVLFHCVPPETRDRDGPRVRNPCRCSVGPV